jgi:hypothetical protein
MTEFMDRQIRLQRAGQKEYSEEEVRLIINGAIQEEREACAQIAHNTYEGFGVDAQGVDFVKQQIIRQIKARGQSEVS